MQVQLTIADEKEKGKTFNPFTTQPILKNTLALHFVWASTK